MVVNTSIRNHPQGEISFKIFCKSSNRVFGFKNRFGKVGYLPGATRGNMVGRWREILYCYRLEIEVLCQRTAMATQDLHKGFTVISTEERLDHR